MVTKARKQRLFEGFISNVGDALSSFFARSPGTQVQNIARGDSPTTSPMTYPAVDARGMWKWMVLYRDLMCLSGDSRVLVLNDGAEWVPIRKLAEDYKDRPDDPIYTVSFDRIQKRIVCSKAYHPRLTLKKEPVFYVVMTGSPNDRNHSYVLKATANHPFLMRDGQTYKRVDQLCPGDSVMPAGLSLKESCELNKYWYIFQPFEVTSGGKHNKQEKLAGLVAECVFGRRPRHGEIVHHKNGDKKCDAPWNIELKEESGHHRDHSKELWDDPVRAANLAKRIRESKGRGSDEGILKFQPNAKNAKSRKCPTTEQELRELVRTSTSVQDVARQLGVGWWTVRSRMVKHGIPCEEIGAAVNHRVVAILPAGEEDVYDLTVPEYENFAAEGVIVHNSRYLDYESMDDYGDISLALDIYADDSTQPDPIKDLCIWPVSPDHVVQAILDGLFDRLGLNDEAWPVSRTLGKYGNVFGELVFGASSVQGINFLPTATMRRVHDPRGFLLGYYQAWDTATLTDRPMRVDEFLQLMNLLRGKRGKEGPAGEGMGKSVFDKVTVFEPWEVVHWRLLREIGLGMGGGKSGGSGYGTSLLDPARWIWRRLTMIEDAMLVHRLTRAPGRYAFYVNTGKKPLDQAWADVQAMKNEYKKRRIVDSASGQLSSAYNPLCLSLDTRIPLLNGTTRTLRDLIVDHDAGVQNYVYSMDPATKRVKPGTISWAGVTRRDARVLRVTLDNCQEVIATPDHQFLLRDGTYKQAQFLDLGDSVMPLYRGINAGGYEYVVHQDHRERGVDKWRSLVPVHRMVAEHFYGDLTDRQVHHLDDRKRNNYPENLEPLVPEEHNARHFSERARRIRRWNKSEAHADQTAYYNRMYGKGRNIIEYNSSPQHKADNAVRSEKIPIKYPEGLLAELGRLVQENATLKIVDAVAAIRALPVHEEFRALNSNRKKVMFGLYHVRTLIHQAGHQDWQGFCSAATTNHKVASVEWLDRTMDTGCITVDVWHNFALDAGAFVKNSVDEDFWIPAIDGDPTTRVETLSGPDYQATDDVEYFRDKLFTALKMPKSMANFGDVSAAKAILSNDDIRVARTVLRIQRTIEIGVDQICETELELAGYDSSKVMWNTMMTVPSSIFDLARIEVLTAKADLAGRLGEIVPAEWILVNLFKFSEEEAHSLMDKWQDEKVWRASTEAMADVEQEEIRREATKRWEEEDTPPADFEGDGGEGGGNGDGKKRPIQKPVKKEVKKKPQMKIPSSVEKAEGRMMQALEREEIRGRDHRKKIEEGIGKILRQDQVLAAKFRGIRPLMDDLRQSMRSRRK